MSTQSEATGQATTAVTAVIAKARATHVPVTPMKARRVVDLIRDLPCDRALAVLRFAPQSASEPVYKVLASAMANAENNLDLDPDTLFVSRAWVDEGPTLRRFRPRAQGRASRINKRTSHITVEVVSIESPEPEQRQRASSSSSSRRRTR